MQSYHACLMMWFLSFFQLDLFFSHGFSVIDILCLGDLQCSRPARHARLPIMATWEALDTYHSAFSASLGCSWLLSASLAACSAQLFILFPGVSSPSFSATISTKISTDRLPKVFSTTSGTTPASSTPSTSSSPLLPPPFISVPARAISGAATSQASVFSLSPASYRPLASR